MARISEGADRLACGVDELSAAVAEAVAELKTEIAALRAASEAAAEPAPPPPPAAEEAQEAEPDDPPPRPRSPRPPRPPRGPACSPSRWPSTAAPARRPPAICARTSSSRIPRRCWTRSTPGLAAEMAQPGALDRRGFLAAGGAATFLCTIGGDTVPVRLAQGRRPRGRRRRGAAASGGRPPRPHRPRAVPDARATAGRPAARVLDRRAHRLLGHRADGARRVDEEARALARQAHDPRLRLPAVERGLRRADRSPAHARADAVRGGRRRDRRALQQPRPQAAPGGHDARRTVSATTPSTTAPISATSRGRGASSAPGEEFTYVWEATPDSVGVWPYHDHGPNHTSTRFGGCSGQ